MRSWLISIAIVLIFVVSKATAQELICFNTSCFEPTPTPETIVLKDSIALEREVNPGFFQMIEAIEERDIDNKKGVDLGVVHQESKYYEILEEMDPFSNKRFLNVPSRDLNWGTHPEYESTRPNIILKYFNKPDEQIDFDFEDSE